MFEHSRVKLVGWYSETASSPMKPPAAAYEILDEDDFDRELRLFGFSHIVISTLSLITSSSFFLKHPFHLLNEFLGQTLLM